MTKRKDFSDNQEFLNYNKDIIRNNYFAFYASIMAMMSVPQIMRLYNVYDKHKNTAYCMWYTGNYNIHSFAWNEEIIDSLSVEIELNKYNNFAFSGQRDLIIRLLSKNQIAYEVIKDRLIYECKKVLFSLDVAAGHLTKATIADLEELSQMSFQYHQEEYKGNGQRDLAYMSGIVKNGIQNGNMYKLSVDNKICSMAQVMSADFNFPLIGQLFTKAEHRNHGCASAILGKLTEQLLADGHKKVGLLGDVENPAALKVFEKIGYQEIYKHILVKTGQR
jgi:GNAT superfamily N-acetyltransferase